MTSGSGTSRLARPAPWDPPRGLWQHKVRTLETPFLDGFPWPNEYAGLTALRGTQRVDGEVRQRAIATLGRLGVLEATGKVDALLSSCARFTERVAAIDAHNRGDLPPSDTVRIGPPLVFGRLWKQLNFHGIIARLLAGRRYELTSSEPSS